MTKYFLYKKLCPGLTASIIPGIQICSEKKAEASIAGGLPTSSGSDDRRHVPSQAPVSVASLVHGPGLLHQSLLHHQAAQAAHSMQGNILRERAIPPTISMSTGDPHNPLFTISGLYPPFTSPLMSRAKPFESPASAASAAGLFPGLGPVPGLLPPHHLNPLLSSHLQAQAAHQGHFGLPHPFFPPTSASPGDRGPGGQKSPILARAGAGGHTGKL